MDSFEDIKEQNDILEDLEILVHNQQDDFDRGKGFDIILKFIEEKRNGND